MRVTNIKIDKNKYAFPLELCKTNSNLKKRSNNIAIFKSCDIYMPYDYNLKECWQEVDVESEITYRTTCLNFDNTKECDLYFSNSSSNLTVNTKIIDTISTSLTAYANASLVQNLIKNLTQQLCLNVNFVIDKCKPTDADFSNCVLNEAELMKKETEMKLKQSPPSNKGIILKKLKNFGINFFFKNAVRFSQRNVVKRMI